MSLERVAQLPQKVIRDVIIERPENERLSAFGHIEGAKCKIEKWKGGSEILVASLIRVGVVPTMKHRVGDSITQWAKCPV